MSKTISACQALQAALQEGVDAVVEVSASATQDSDTPMQENGPTATSDQESALTRDARTAKLAFALQVVLQATRGGESVCLGSFQPTIVALLPLLFRVQVCWVMLPAHCRVHMDRVPCKQQFCYAGYNIALSWSFCSMLD